MCGVIGIIGPKSETNQSWAAYEVYNGLLKLQHRGQDAAGILSLDSDQFHLKKNLGLVPTALTKDDIDGLYGSIAIGHTRYATAGADSPSDLQPMLADSAYGLGMAHNGNLVNYHELARHCKQDLQMPLRSTNDLEVFLRLWCYSLQQGSVSPQNISFSDAVNATRNTFTQVDGAYAVVGILENMGLFAFRDPQGIRPLVLGRKITDNGIFHCVASETSALDFLEYEILRDVLPGELIFISPEGNLHSKIVQNEKKNAHCMFEWVYFAGAESQLDDKSVYRSRLNLGKVLAKRVTAAIEHGEIEPDIVCPVPDTSRPATISLAEEIGIPYREAFIKNRYIQRSFILSSQEARERAVKLKLSPIVSEIKGKNILLVDDSVVRGTTSRNIVILLKKYGAKKITLAITCPPIRHGCFYGIDFPDTRELIATDRNLNEIAEWIGVDQILYLDTNDLEEAIGTNALCMGCINGKYPTQNRGSEEFRLKRRGIV